jgi:hypothetical protein
MQKTKKNNDAARDAGQKLIARSVATGLYFNGAAFAAPTAESALALRPGTTSEDFKLSWSGAVDVVEAEEELAKLRDRSPNYGRKSLAQRINSGELDKYGAARVYVIERNREGQKSFCIRTPAKGRYISRVVKLESRGANPSAYVNYLGTQISVVWIGGELAVDAR